MKRTNLVLDADLLERATRALGAKTYSVAVNQALEQVPRIEKIRRLASFYGQGLWRAIFQRCGKTGRRGPPQGEGEARPNNPGRHLIWIEFLNGDLESFESSEKII